MTTSPNDNSPPVRLALSMGDPTGIGPEIICKAIAHLRSSGWLESHAHLTLFADAPLMHFTADELGLPDLFDDQASPHVRLVHTTVPVTGDQRPGVLAAAGRISHRCVERAIDAVIGEEPADSPRDQAAQPKPTATPDQLCEAIVTAPISKEAWHAAGIDYPGHTELLAERFDSPRSAMLFVGPTLRVILVTIHIPLRDVPRKVNPARVLDAIELGNAACLALGVKQPRIAVAGINPHAGENGLFGSEDAELILPAVERAKERGLNVAGPLPGDAVFLAAAKGHHDLVVAMYHDQGLIPVKLLDRAHAVNVTVGLKHQGKPVVRTSPAHGTANDIAGQNIADATSMIESITLAANMVNRNRQHT